MAHERFIFINNILPIGRILTGEKTLPIPVDFSDWLKRRNSRKQSPLTNFYQRLFQSNDPLIVSFEDHFPDIMPFLNPPDDVTNVLVLRDPYNMLASRIRKASQNRTPYPKENGPIMPASYLRYGRRTAREYLGLTGHLENKVAVYFNDWFSSHDYRQQLSLAMGLDFSDEGVFQNFKDWRRKLIRWQ